MQGNVSFKPQADATRPTRRALLLEDVATVEVAVLIKRVVDRGMNGGEFLAGHDPRDVFGKNGLVEELKKALSERILNAEIK